VFSTFSESPRISRILPFNRPEWPPIPPRIRPGVSASSWARPTATATRSRTAPSQSVRDDAVQRRRREGGLGPPIPCSYLCRYQPCSRLSQRRSLSWGFGLDLPGNATLLHDSTVKARFIARYRIRAGAEALEVVRDMGNQHFYKASVVNRENLPR
jgi:hypothetical protein